MNMLNTLNFHRMATQCAVDYGFSLSDCLADWELQPHVVPSITKEYPGA